MQMLTTFSDMPKQTQAQLVLVSIQLCFSGWHIIGALSMSDGINPFIFVLYRTVAASILMFAYIKFYGMDLDVKEKDYLRFLFLGVCSFVNVTCSMLALKFISATRFSIFQPSIPCITAVLSVILGLEHITPLKSVGIIIAVIGAVVAEIWKDTSVVSSTELNLPLGTVLVCVQILVMSSMQVALKPLLSSYQPAVATFVYYSIGASGCVLVALARADTYTTSSFSLNGDLFPWLTLLYSVLASTLYAFIGLAWCGRQLDPSVTTVYFTFQPVGTILLSFLLLGKLITLPEMIGGTLVVLGLAVTVLAQRLAVKKQNQQQACQEGTLHDDMSKSPSSYMSQLPEKLHILIRSDSSNISMDTCSTCDSSSLCSSLNSSPDNNRNNNNNYHGGSSSSSRSGGISTSIQYSPLQHEENQTENIVVDGSSIELTTTSHTTGNRLVNRTTDDIV